MLSNMTVWLKLLLAVLLSAGISFFMTPPVKKFAEKVGAIDVPKDDRRVHNHPIPRMGGLAIFFGFVLSVLVFVDMSTPIMGMLIGAVIIAAMGAVDDIVSLNAWVKFGIQILAALVAIRSGIVFDVISNPRQSLYPHRLSDCSADGAVDRRLHQRGEPDRRAGRTGRGRVGHQLPDHAGGGSFRIRAERGPDPCRPHRRLSGLYPL